MLWALLRRIGVEGVIRFGAKKAGESLEAHAWVEWNGVPLNDVADVRSRYAVPEAALLGTARGSRSPK